MLPRTPSDTLKTRCRTVALIIPAAARRWLLPICLVALIAAVWTLPYRPDCDSLAWGEGPAIARIDSQCILLPHYADWLYIIETTMQRQEQGLLPEHPDPEYQRRWRDRVNSYGPETIALADTIRDAALFQRAVAGGHAPSEEELLIRLDQERLRRETLKDIIQLVKLAQNQDPAGFRKLAEETRNPDIRSSLEGQTSVELMEAMKRDDWRHLEQMLKEGEAYLEYVGHERYWQTILPAKLGREMAIGRLEEAVLEASADGPYVEVPRLAWLAYLQEVLEGVSIELTRAAPQTVSVDRALAYLSDVLQEEQDELSEEYNRGLNGASTRVGLGGGSVEIACEISVALLFCGFGVIVALFGFVERARKPVPIVVFAAGYAAVVAVALLLCLPGN